MAIVNKFNVNKQQVTLDADIIENMSANDVSYDASTQYNENTVGNKLSELSKQGQQVIYDVSSHNNGATFASLSELLSSENLSTLIPTSVRHGGMSIRFVNSSDNKYVQYRYMGTATTGSPNTFLDESNWQGVDDEPTAGSNNLVKSGGVKRELNEISESVKYNNEVLYKKANTTVILSNNIFDINSPDNINGYINELGEIITVEGYPYGTSPPHNT